MSNITIKTPEEIAKLKEGGKILSSVLDKVSLAAKPGVTTEELDQLAKKLIKEAGATPSFEGYGEPPFPAALCTSINEAIVHGLPSERKLKEGDIIGLDLGIWYKGLCTDMARTVGVGKISKENKKLINVTHESLKIGLKQIKPGKTLGDIGYAIQSFAEKHGYGVVRELVGHGVGYEVHEDPRIPNFGRPGEGEVLKEGMVLAIEPMITAGDYRIEILDNDWDIITKDGSMAAHFEHTIAVTKKGCDILTK